MVDRPVECSQCQKPVAVVYKELSSTHFARCVMCKDCPALRQKLCGNPSVSLTESPAEATGLCCSKCGTSLFAIERGEFVGCSECYQVFGESITQLLSSLDKIPSSAQEAMNKKNLPLHIGKTPKTSHEIPSSSRLSALMEALNEALSKENYEQAALLRDQIASLKGVSDGRA